MQPGQPAKMSTGGSLLDPSSPVEGQPVGPAALPENVGFAPGGIGFADDRFSLPNTVPGAEMYMSQPDEQESFETNYAARESVKRNKIPTNHAATESVKRDKIPKIPSRVNQSHRVTGQFGS